MSFLRHLGEFALGVFQGYSESQAERRAANPAQTDGYSFPAHIRMLARETGLPLVSVDGQGASFSLSVSEEEYGVLLVMIGERINMAVTSLISFPPGRAPRDICEMLVERNRKLPRCEFGLIDKDNGAYFYIECAIHYASLTPQAFEAAVKDLAPKIVALDAYLVENGYVR